ncbi:MAG: LD-carboxypeptidase [Bacteroidetes bacterium]|nr:LD-carboxypeptidase [Bacteroidota bacterium]
MKIPFLKPNDKVAITAPAKRISRKEIDAAVKVLIDWGLQVVVGETIDSEYFQFSAPKEKRLDEVQTFLDDPEIKAVFFARGGYGSIQIIDNIDFKAFKKNPKWLIGFSDITVFHSHLNAKILAPSIHATMPLNFEKNSKETLSTLKEAVFKGKMKYELKTKHKLNRKGKGKGEIVGGNLSIIYSLLGSKSFPNLKGKILFLEDLNEYYYHLDRMMYSLKRAGALKDLKGLLIGQFSDMQEAALPFDKNTEEIIYDAVKEYKFPIYFNFPAGHVADNRALIFGKEVKMEVDEKGLKLG